MVAGENQDLNLIQPGHLPALPGRQPKGQILQFAKRALWFGQAVIACFRRRRRLAIGLRQVRQKAAQVIVCLRHVGPFDCYAVRD